MQGAFQALEQLQNGMEPEVEKPWLIFSWWLVVVGAWKGGKGASDLGVLVVMKKSL